MVDEVFEMSGTLANMKYMGIFESVVSSKWVESDSIVEWEDGSYTVVISQNRLELNEDEFTQMCRMISYAKSKGILNE
jgi:hypothetical protein